MSLPRPKLRIIISGGGTGGHIFPAIAIADALKKMNPASEFLFVGAKGRMEMEKVPAAGYSIVGLNISGIQRKLSFRNLLLPLKVMESIMKARKIIRSFSPDAAIGVGGYASGPLLYAATAMHIPSLIQEQNSFAGVTNKILAKRVQKICVAYHNMERFFPAGKLVVTGNPVREQMTQTEGKRDAALRFFGLDRARKTLLVIGGSLGARTINESIAQGLVKINTSEVQLIWQTGHSYAAQALAHISKGDYAGIKTFDFIREMDYAYAAADIIVSRAGASSVSELALVGKPAILVPSPNVAEDHQTKNAMALVEKDAAILVNDADAESRLVQTALELMHDDARRKSLGDNISKLAKHDSAARIADEVYQMIEAGNLK